jgi:hypothetical protein
MAIVERIGTHYRCGSCGWEDHVLQGGLDENGVLCWDIGAKWPTKCPSCGWCELAEKQDPTPQRRPRS